MVAARDESTRVVADATTIVGAADPSPTFEPLPDELDRYVVLDTIGTGGMGVVVSAYDPELDRTVALKILRPRGRGPIERERAQRALLREARAAAALSHPNVVQIFDVGHTGDRVWFAMEHVRGPTLTRWLETGAHGWQRVLDRFVEAGRGLAAAHRAGLVHGDFKPSNVLCADDGRVLVADFGLAHPHGSKDSADDVPGSGDGASSGAWVLGTPLYMAPESLSDGITDARTDQFAFCVALWQALWRRHPFADDSDDPRDVLVRLRAHRRGPSPPRLGVPLALRRVVERGLVREPTARWPDMDALLAALARAVAPLRPWSLVPVACGVLAVAAAASRDGDPECDRDRTALAATWTAARRGEIEDGLAAVDRVHADDVAARVAARLDDYAAALGGAFARVCEVVPAVEVSTRHERRACLDQRREDLAALLDQLARADAGLLDHAIGAVAELPRPEGCEIDGRLAIGDAVERGLRPALARMAALVNTGRAEAAVEIGEDLLAEARVTGDGPAIAAVLDALGNAYEGATRLSEAESAWSEAVWTATAHGRDEIAARAATSLVSSVGFQQSRPDDGLVWVRSAETALRRAGADDAAWASLYNAEGLAHVAAGAYEDGVADYERALALTDRGLDRASVLNNLGPALLRAGRVSEARTAIEASLAIIEDELGPTHPRLAGTLGNCGMIAQEQGDHAAALAHLERALAIGEAAHGPDHPTVAFALNNIANHHYDRGRGDLALPLYLRVVEVIERAYGDHPNTALAIANVGLVLNELDRPGEALVYHRRALAMTAATVGEDHPEYAQVLNNIGSAQRELGRLDEAEASYGRALALREATLGRDHPLTATTVLNLARVAARREQPARARELALRALAIWERRLGPDHARVGMALAVAGAAAGALGEVELARRELVRAVAIASAGDGDPDDLATALGALAQLERGSDRRRSDAGVAGTLAR